MHAEVQNLFGRVEHDAGGVKTVVRAAAGDVLVELDELVVEGAIEWKIREMRLLTRGGATNTT